eukprot:m51a1_g1540 putative calcium-transporting P-type ATPase (1144) ;mRNA; f:542031-546285
MDNLRVEARDKAGLNLRELCEHRAPLDKKTAKTLVSFLVSRCGTVDEQHVVAQALVPEAKAALHLVFFFLRADQAFQAEFEGLSVGTIASRMRLDMHVAEGPEEHARTALLLISFLSNHFSKFANWRLYVRRQAHEQVREGLFRLLPTAEVPEMVRSPDLMRVSRVIHVADDDAGMTSGEEQGGRMAGAAAMTAIRLKDHLPPPEDSGWYHANSPQEVEKIFCTRISKGLTTVEVEERLADFGRNELPRSQPPSPLRMLLEQLTDFMMLTLIVVLVIELALQKWAPAVVLFVVIAFQATVGFVQELKAQRALQSLESLQVPSATVVRFGSVQTIDSRDIVPGDIVLLEEGCKVPADLRLVETAGLSVLESVLTGESVGVEKSTAAISGNSVALGDMTNTAFMSTAVLRGRAKGIAVATGRHTEIGKISKVLSHKGDNKTLLQKKLAVLGKVLVAGAVAVCALVVAIYLVRTRLRRKLDKDDAMGALELGVILGVSAIPEGLVAVVTVAMAAGVKRMVKQSAIVKRLATVEALGSVTTICSDKTGTLTQGCMVAAELRTPLYSVTFPVSPIGEGMLVVGADGAPASARTWPPQFEAAVMCCALCNNAHVSRESEDGDGGWTYTGDPTEGAIAVAAEKMALGKAHWQSAGWSFVCEEPFDSDRKFMSVVYRDDKSGRHLLLAKGAPEAVLSRCVSSLVGALDAAVIDGDAADMARKGMRVLALAVREVDGEAVAAALASPEQLERGLVFAGFVGLVDPPRPEVASAISVCKEAGIKVCMITGDHPLTALAIASQLGIAEPNDDKALMRGTDLEALPDEQALASRDPFPTVFARVSPEHKMKIVRALRSRQEICVMTGDGVNDAPALKESNIGVAMGKAGADLTKDTADMILLDDNFRTIVMAVQEGRHIFDSIKKFVVFLVSCNLSEVVVMFLCAALGLPMPFLPIVILVVNLGEALPAMALGFEPHDRGLMSRKPRNPSKGILSRKAWMLLTLQGVSMGVLVAIVYSLLVALEEPEAADETSDGKTPEGLQRARAVALITIACLHNMHSLLSRSLHNSVFVINPFRNKWLLLAVATNLIIVCFITFVPRVDDLFGLGMPYGTDIAKMLGCCVIHFTVVELFKVYLRCSAKRSASRQSGLWYSEV